MQNHTNRLRNEAARKIQKQATGHVVAQARQVALEYQTQTKRRTEDTKASAGYVDAQARQIAGKVQREQNASKRIKGKRVTLLRKRVQQKIDDRRLKELMNASIKRDAAIKIQRAFRKRSEGRDKLPNDWPSNLARPDVKDYLKMYSLKLKKTMPIKTTKLIGTGNRCKNKGNPENSSLSPRR